MGIYDIIGQRDNEDQNIASALAEHIENPSTYAKAIKWDEGLQEERARKRIY